MIQSSPTVLSHLLLLTLLGTGTLAPSVPDEVMLLEERRCPGSSLLTLPLPGFNCAHKGKPEASEASLRQSQRQGDLRLGLQSRLSSPPLCPAATTVSEPAGVLHISYVQQSGGTMEQIMNKLEAELWNSSLCEPPRCLLGLLARGGTGVGTSQQQKVSRGSPTSYPDGNIKCCKTTRAESERKPSK